MSNIVGIGANVCDTLITVSHYPKEDTKLKATAVKKSGGGPCATGLVVAAKLGESTAFIGNLADDSEGIYLKDDMHRYNVSTEYIEMKNGCKSFCSTIFLAQNTASRTCVFDRGNVPQLKLNEKQKQVIKNAKLLMVDGNEMSAAIDGAKIAKENGVKVLYDAGGLYEGAEKLLTYADILIPSEEFAMGFTKEKTVEAAAKNLFDRYLPEIVVITQGAKGGIVYDGNSMREYSAFKVSAVDTNGSGDVFHGAFAFAVVKGFDFYRAAVFSSAVSAVKCTKTGAREGAPEYSEVIKFLKERGVNV